MFTLSPFGQAFYYLEISNMKSLVGLTWDSNPDTIQALGLETAMIPLLHGGSCIFPGQIVESLVIISPTHLKNLCCLLITISTKTCCSPGENLAQGFFSCGPTVSLVELSNVKRLISVTWDLILHTIQNLGFETATILLSHKEPCISAG